MGRDHLEICYLRLYQCIRNTDLADQHFVQCPFAVILRRKIQSGCSVGLRIRVDDEDLLLQNRQ